LNYHSRIVKVRPRGGGWLAAMIVIAFVAGCANSSGTAVDAGSDAAAPDKTVPDAAASDADASRSSDATDVSPLKDGGSDAADAAPMDTHDSGSNEPLGADADAATADGPGSGTNGADSGTDGDGATDGALSAEQVCNNVCTLHVATVCPNTGTFADCVNGCMSDVADPVCGLAFLVYYNCAGNLTADDWTCDPGFGRPTNKDTTCVTESNAVDSCLGA
jgi:hypothetical protein